MQEEDESGPIYFPVSIAKLIVLSVCTLGFYELYWFFKNWQLVAARTGAGRYVVPGLQTALVFFCCYPLFKRIARTSRGTSAARISPGLLAISWVALHLTQRLPDPYWIVSMASVVPLVFVQTTINEINTALSPTCANNARFSIWNLLVCTIGAGVLAFGLIYTFAPELLPE